MNVAIWTCIACNKVWEGEWLGGAWMMASKCPYCKSTGLSSQEFSRPIGTLFIKNEKIFSVSGV
jgi:hypothetical protein